MMSVLPTAEEETHHHQHQQQQLTRNECRDDYDEIATATSSISGTTDREDRGITSSSSRKNILMLQATNSMISSSGMASATNTGSSSCPRRSEGRSPPISVLGSEDFLGGNEADDDIPININTESFASHAADACVACSIPVLHFIHFFMC